MMVLSEKNKVMELKGIKMIGNVDTHCLIGLSDEGNTLLQRIIAGEEIIVETISPEQKELYNALLTSGFFVESTSYQINKVVYLHITTKCNMKCYGCYSENSCEHDNIDMSIDKVNRILDDLLLNGYKELIISGGEPFLHEKIIDILEMAKRKNYNVTCISNGTADIDMYKAALEFVDRLAFSMDGISPETSTLRKTSFEQVENTIISLSPSYNEKMAIIFTLHKKNVGMYSLMKNYALDRGINYNFSLFSIDKSKDLNHLMITPGEMKALLSNVNIDDVTTTNGLQCSESCEAGRNLISISADGSVFPCHMLMNNKFRLGNYDNEKISDIMKNARFHESNSVDNKKICSLCEYRYLCGGGCVYRAYAYYGDVLRGDPLCECYKNQICDYLKPYTNKEK